MNEPDSNCPLSGVVDRVLEQRLADALDDAAMDLAFEQQRIDGAAEIVDHGVALDGDHAGVGIDLDLDDVAAVGKGLRRRHAVMRRVEPGLHPRRQLGRIARRLRHVEQIDAQIGAGHAEFAVGEARCPAPTTSSRCAAIWLPLSTIVRPASYSAAPPTASAREPPVSPAGVRSVSPMITSMRSAIDAELIARRSACMR